MSITEKLEKWAQKQLAKKIAKGGKLVSDQHAAARKAICAACPKAGKVRIELKMLTVEAEGCTQCGCPFATKPHIDIIVRDAKKAEGAILTAGEILRTQTGMTDTRKEKVICPHPEGNKWAEIDEIFQN